MQASKASAAAQTIIGSVRILAMLLENTDEAAQAPRERRSWLVGLARIGYVLRQHTGL